MIKLKKAEGLQITGRWRLTARHTITGEVKVKEGDNLIVNVGKYLIGRMLIDEATYDVGFTHQAIGRDATPPAVGQAGLIDEANRLAITSKTRLLNEVTLSTFFTAAQSTFAIEEAGVFGHTAGAIMFSRWLVSFDNSGGLFDLTFDYILTIG